MNPSGKWVRRIAFAIFALVFIAAVRVYLGLFDEPKPAGGDSQASSKAIGVSLFKNTSSEVAYVGDEACARCHAEIVQSYRHHPMGRSMTTPDRLPSPLQGSGKVLEFKDLAYWIQHRDGKVYHRETRENKSSEPVTIAEHEVRYVVGSGDREYAFLVERGSGLALSPIGWDAVKQGWELAPGFQNLKKHFDVQVMDDCLFCHANRFEKSETKLVTFHGLAIGCERCHGPGALHVQKPEKVDGIDRTIVNPAKLSSLSLRDNVCEQCHIQGYRRKELFSDSFSRYRPGLPLEDYFSITPERFGVTRQLETIGHVQQMKDSRCYQGSKGELGCVSCHDPHKRPEPATRVTYYQKRCLTCHADKGCKLPGEERLRRNPEDDCVSCHMPPISKDHLRHAARTDHSIPR